jgi:glucose/arabinose dehydrogenase
VSFGAALLTLVLGLTLARAGSLPSGFEDVPVTGGLAAPTAIAFAPDDRLFICEKGGAVRIFKQGQLLAAPFLQLSVTSNSERGVLGIAFDPAFAAEPYVYIYYTTGPGSLSYSGSPKNRVSRFLAEGDAAMPGSEQILVDNIPSDAGNHNAGCVRFGLDGKLYISTGDGGSNPNLSQNLGSLAGKILRVNKQDGSAPSDNPFFNQMGRRGEIYCYGLRNPFRFNFRPGTNTLYIADVGQNTWEEVNVGQAGGDFGWPDSEGPNVNQGEIAPIHAYRHQNGGASITGGCFITSSNYPTLYQGAYFFGDYVQGRLGFLRVNANNTLIQAHELGPASGPVDFAQGPDGNLYYVSISTGSVRMLRFQGGENRPPVARSSANPMAGSAPLTVDFSSAGTNDPDGDVLSYLWDFDDGTTSTQPNPRRTFNQPGVYSVGLRVSDGRGGVSQAKPLEIQVGNNAPTVRILSPRDESRYRAGDTVQFSGRATDREDGTLAPSALHWVVTFYHSDHTHPFEEFSGVSSGSFTIPRVGEPSADTWYEIELTATDSGGAKGVSRIQIRPRKTRLTFKTKPKGLTITFNGQPQTTPFRVQSVVGFEHLIGAPDQSKNGTSYVFRSWSDRGAREHTIRAPGSGKTYTARFAR